MRIDRLEVRYRQQAVGTLALTADRRIAFEYKEEWLKNGFSISPFSLPLRKQIFLPEKNYFHGLFGVFADSLPDAWGNLLLTRLMIKKGMSMDQVTMLDRLAIVGDTGMGALSYQPEMKLADSQEMNDLDALCEECQKILNSEYSENLDEIYRLGGTSGGARPKILVEIDGNPWMIKFPAHTDAKDIGRMEYDYSLCAKACDIPMTETRLFPSARCKGYFGTRRFDRDGGKRFHVLTAAALLELDFTQPSLDYHSLMKLTKILTRNRKSDLENMYRYMCFNVFAHNRDDHSKNFSYIYDEENDHWHLSPAYDMTYSNTYYGEHTTMVNGNGINPGMDDILKVGTAAGLKKGWCEETAGRMKKMIGEQLREYLGGGKKI